MVNFTVRLHVGEGYVQFDADYFWDGDICVVSFWATSWTEDLNSVFPGTDGESGFDESGAFQEYLVEFVKAHPHLEGTVSFFRWPSELSILDDLGRYDYEVEYGTTIKE